MSNSVTNLTDDLITSSVYYNDGNKFFDYVTMGANCTTYAYCTAMYLLGVDTKFHLFGNGSYWYHNATNWYSEYNFSKGKTPKIGAIACWSVSDGGNTAGHVAIVIAIHDDGTIDVAQGAYKSSRFYRTINYNYNRSNFAGFLYLCYEDETLYEPPGNFKEDVENFYQLDYIQGTGTQYIDTGWRSNYSIGFEVTAKYQFDRTGDRCCLLSSYSTYDPNDSENHKTSFEVQDSRSREWLDNGNVDNKSSTLSESTNHVSYFSYDSDGKYKHIVDGTTVANGSYSCSGKNAYSAFIFLDRALRTDTFDDTLRMSSLQIAENGSQVHNFVAAIRKSDNLLGMYDVVNNKFYYNIGTNSFSKGLLQSGTVSVVISGSGSVTGEGTYNKNPDGCFRTTLVATPSSGIVFTGWYNSSGELLSTDTSYSIADNTDTTYTAVFGGVGPTTLPLYIKQSGNWCTADNLYIKKLGSWIQSNDLYVNVSSSWKK